ncbi:hypothetical protein D0Y65_034201 [Glycine soja]|uniref:PB1-like domain-containing protein n=1 Tax=Glycine soja TaxID=3848 RepID=A0A445HPH5_GLYSO|nr:hypothetical protein D0Y65_034201 [Glycine soja]
MKILVALQQIFCPYSIGKRVDLLKELGYDFSNYRLWWKHRDANFEQGLKEFANDNDALQLCNYALINEDREVDDIDVDYMSEELDSGNESDGDDNIWLKKV